MIKNLLKLYGSNKSRNYVIITQVINAIIGLVSGKLIALYILPEDFGAYNIQFATYNLVFAILLSPFIQFLKASYNDLLNKIGSRFFINTYICILILSYTLLSSVFYFMYNIKDLKLYLLLFFFMVMANLYSICSDFFIIKSKLTTFSKFSVFKGLFGLLFLSSFIYLGLNWLSNIQLLWAMQIVGALVALLFFSKHYLFFKGTKQIAYRTFFKRYRKFVLPLIFVAFWAWINNFFDRYALEYFLGLNEVGVYNANYGIGSKFFIMLSPIFIVMATPKVYSSVSIKKKKETIITFGKYYTYIAIIILLIIYFFKDMIGNLLLSEQYKEGFFIVFWIALAFFVYTLTRLYELIFYSEKNTKIILYSNIVSASINIIGNLMLIPVYGMFGAVLATLIGFIFQFIVVCFYFNKI